MWLSPLRRRDRFSERRRRWRRSRRVLFGVLAVLLAGGIAFSLRYRLVWVVGQSMRPTFDTGDLLVVDRQAYESAGPARGDIVVAKHRDELIVKRVVGLPGEEVEVRRGQVEVNGVRPVVYYDFAPGFLDIAPGRLLADRYAILGDNRSVEPSAFIHGVVSSRQIFGKVVWAIRWSAVRS